MFGRPYVAPLPFCGCFIWVESVQKFLPQVKVNVHTTILDTTSRTTLTQTFANPNKDKALDEIKYVFPLYDGVSVVAFTCTVGDRVIKGVVKERQKAKQVYEEATARGETAGLFEQSLESADVFTTTIGNVPAGEKITVDITYLGELKHDAEVDGVRFTIPTQIAPRYGATSSLSSSHPWFKEEGISITVDAEMPDGSAIKSIQSPSHPISVSIGTTSAAASAEPSLRKASATLSQGAANLDKEFVIQVVATKMGEPSAFVETHPTIPNQRALMATLVPKFKLPAEKPEIVFLCDRSGSMSGTIPDLVAALNIFLKSLPVGVKFNICSFGSSFTFLWPKSKTYSQESLDEAVRHIATFGADYGGTEMVEPFKATVERRYKDMNLEVFLLTDGAIWDQARLFELVNEKVTESKGAVRVFSLGVGSGASTALIEGVARAGNGFSQTVADNEKMDKKVVRMLKGSLFPHITDYTLDIKYEKSETKAVETEDDDDFEVVEKVMDALSIRTLVEKEEEKKPKEKISLFDSSVDADDDTEMADAPNALDTKFDHLPTATVPRYLQTPATIPPLFPFNRTTVYVLLSDSTPAQKPKSVILRGTSTRGPLELEIPIVNLADKATTIHQLAARKEVKELEEGRGWLTLAKDEAGKLLKEKHEGYFSDMVEREAVRLGVEYQVGGKWCSFVAVEESDDSTGDGPKKEKAAQSMNELITRVTERGERLDSLVNSATALNAQAVGFARTARKSSGSMFGSSMFSSKKKSSAAPMASFGAPPPAPLARRLASPIVNLFGGGGSSAQPQQMIQPQQMMQSQGLFGGPPSGGRGGGAFGGAPQAPGGGLFGNAPQAAGGGLFGNATQASGFGSSNSASCSADGASPFMSKPSATGSLFGSAPPHPPAAPGMMMLSAQPTGFSAADESYEKGIGNATPALEATKSSTASRRRSLFSMASSPAPASAPASLPTPDTSDPLQTLTSLQTFVGSWSWSGTLEKVLGVTSAAASKLNLPDTVASRADRDVILATMCAVVFFKKNLKAEKDAWEMLVEKAETWLEEQLGESVEELEKLIESLF
ncbi:von Willebrand factor type A domain-containing protein [Ilyonectria robusta]|uniref:von Willebrand factor type A domain-containing protein n=1 Tax=Ilyonectria robusta TaxID=1079257 RepID=UPI001E8DC08C|nr:von Willebrand factor type A domain-containing protein [Ilyonectria robusta]KAH8686558.1 von Willebrand factor type A domain-containing protein [Ilyonectria robusta]